MSWLASLLVSGFIMSNFGSATSTRLIEPANPAAQVITAAEGEEVEHFDQTYPFSSNGSIALENLNGSVTIETWDRNEVRVEYTKTGSDKEIMSWVDVEINAAKERIEITADYDKWKNGDNSNWERWKNRKVDVTFKLTVPRNAILNEVETVNGSIILANMTNFCKVSTVNGNVSAHNLRGPVNLSTVNGNLDADFDHLDGSNQITLNTVNGRVVMTIPSDTDATLKADTVNGSIANDFGLPVRKGEFVGRDLYGKIGSGTAKVRLSSVNGGLSVVRKKDGKVLSPAINLLQMNKDADDDDEDMDNDDDNDSDSRARTRDVERAVRDAVRTVPQTLDDVNVNVEINQEMLKELARVQKEVAKTTLDQTKIIDGQVKAALLDTQNALASIYVLPENNLLPTADRQGETLAVKGTPKIIVDARNCAIVIRGWDRSEVQYSLTKITRSTPVPANGLTVEKSDSQVKIKFADTNQLNHYRLDIFVPKRSDLKISSDKGIRLDGISGELELSSPGEAINVRDSGGKLNVATVNGEVRVIGFQGELNSATLEGTMNLEGSFTKFSANAGNGTLVLTLPENTGAYLATRSDNVFAEGMPLAKENDKWKIGKGGDVYNVQTLPDGKIVIRSTSSLRAGF